MDIDGCFSVRTVLTLDSGTALTGEMHYNTKYGIPFKVYSAIRRISYLHHGGFVGSRQMANSSCSN